MAIVNIKSKIKELLDDLVTAGVIASATEMDYKKDLLDKDGGAYPRAILQPPSIESENIDNRTVMRTYEFNISIVEKTDNLTDASELETLQERIMDFFDQRLDTLEGVADGGVEPALSTPEPLNHRGQDLITFDIILKVSATKSLDFENNN